MTELQAEGKAALRKRLREVMGGLYGIDMQKRFESPQALGLLASDEPEAVEKTWNRIFYAFDDTMSCWGVAEGLGEIARNFPRLRPKILALLRKFQDDESTCQGFLWAVCRIGQVDRRLMKDFVPDMERALESGASCMTGQALWAIGEIVPLSRPSTLAISLPPLPSQYICAIISRSSIVMCL